MPCLFFNARSRKTFGPRRHIDLAFYPGQPTLVSHPACNTFDPAPSNRRRLPAFISPQHFHSYTGKLIYFLPPDTAGCSHIVSSVSARTAGKNSTMETGDFERWRKGQLWLKPLLFSPSPFHLLAWILAIFPKETPTTSVFFEPSPWDGCESNMEVYTILRNSFISRAKR